MKLTRQEVYAPGGINERAHAGDPDAIRQWNDWCAAESKRYAEKDRRVSFGAIQKAYLQLWGG